MNRTKFRTRRIITTFLVIATVLISLKTNAQDTIYLKSKRPVIIAKILEVNPTNLKYKKHSNIDGPAYTIEKTKIEKVVYKNGDVERYSSDSLNAKSIKRQTSQDLISGSRIFLTYSPTEGEDNVNGSDAKGMLKSYLEGKTTCIVVNSIDEADFVIELRVIKKAMADRSAMIVIKHILTDKDVFETKWVRGSSSAFYGYSGSRAAIGKVVKKYLLKKYPEIEI